MEKPVEYIVKVFEGPKEYEYEYRTEDQAIGHFNMEMSISHGMAFVEIWAYYWDGNRRREERIK